MRLVHLMYVCAFETSELSRSNTLDLGLQTGRKVQLSQTRPRQ